MASWIEVSEGRLVGNFRAVKAAAGADTEVLAVVKADAYGHGARRCGVALARAGARWLGVTDAAEGARVRRALEEDGILRVGPGEPRVMAMCGFLPEDVATLERYWLTPIVWTPDQVAALRGWEGPGVHVEVDTGMARQGVRPGADLEALLNGMEEAGVAMDGLLTHFACAEEAGSEATARQQTRFEGAVEQVRARGIRLGWVHAGNSSSVDADEGMEREWLVGLARSVGARAMVRSGLAMYGYCLPLVSAEGELAARLRDAVRPVMTWKTRVLAVRDLAAGDTVGYGAAFCAPGAMRVALLPVGYADGLRREVSSANLPGRVQAGGWVMIAGHRAGIVGRVSMNLTVVDVTGIAGVAMGDDVVLLGDGITAEDHARVAGTIAYEILCGVRAG